MLSISSSARKERAPFRGSKLVSSFFFPLLILSAVSIVLELLGCRLVVLVIVAALCRLPFRSRLFLWNWLWLWLSFRFGCSASRGFGCDIESSAHSRNTIATVGHVLAVRAPRPKIG
jgi:hypothetical protein